MATSVEEENPAETTTPPTEKITAFRTETSSLSSRRSLRMVIVVIAAIIGIILMM